MKQWPFSALGFCLISLLTLTVEAQDTAYIRRQTAVLASDSLSGRGYVSNGMGRAAAHIAAEMKRIGLDTVPGLNGRYQWFKYPVNTFPGRMMLTVNGVLLEPGADYLVNPESRSFNGTGFLEQTDSVTWLDRDNLVALRTTPKLTWGVSNEQAGYTMFQTSGLELPDYIQYKATVDAALVPQFNAANVAGLVRGTTHPDSMLVLCAHYDHLGGMGSQTFFKGANDNASGVALMLAMAAYYKLHPLPYSVLFIAFAGEEAGLKGSRYWVEHSPVKLTNLRFVLNLDLMGNGEEGITVVNATAHPEAFAALQQIQDKSNLFSALLQRGQAANSDHFPFAEVGVPAFFIYTMGARKSYHDVEDIAATVPWFEARDLGELIRQFFGWLSGAAL